MTLPPARLSVLMAARNAAPWVVQAIQSVRWALPEGGELLVVDDGSTDGTGAILDGLADRGVRVVHTQPRGLSAALNLALRLTQAPLVARMDADDWAMPGRFSRPLAFLEAHPEVGLVGGWAMEIDVHGQVVRRVEPPTGDAPLRRCLLRRNPFVHSAVTMRRAVVEAVGGYDETFSVTQDYDLWTRMAPLTQLANVPSLLVLRRLHGGQASRRPWARRRAQLRIQSRMLWNFAHR